jgi:hypothetical protein
MTLEGARDRLADELRAREGKRLSARSMKNLPELGSPARMVRVPSPTAPLGMGALGSRTTSTYGYTGAGSSKHQVQTVAVARAKRLRPCPVCQQSVRKLARHIAKCHPAETELLASLRGLNPAAATAAAHANAVQSALVRPSQATSRAMVRTSSQTASTGSLVSRRAKTTQLTADLVLPLQRSGGVFVVGCPVCRLLVAPENIWEHVSRAHPRVDFTNWRLASAPSRAATGRKAVSMPAKQAGKGNSTRRAGAMKKSSPNYGATIAEGRRAPSSKSAPPSKSKKLPRAAKGSRVQKFRTHFSTPPEVRHERAADATRLYAERYRESGRFGSHASHDDYGDES